MTDVGTQEDPNIYHIAVKGGIEKIVDSNKINDEMARQIFALGLQTMINSVGMSKLTPGVTKLEGEELTKRQEEISARADETIEQIYSGAVKTRGAKTKKASSAVETEALRLARNMAKDIIRQNGQRQNAYSAKDHTTFAKAVLERNRTALIALAEKNLAEREEEAKGFKLPNLVEVFGEMANDPEKKAKPKTAPKRKGTGEKAPLSAAQASKVAPRQKPTHLAH